MLQVKGTVEGQKSVKDGKYLITAVVIQGEKYSIDVFEKSNTNVREEGSSVIVELTAQRSGKLSVNLK